MNVAVRPEPAAPPRPGPRRAAGGVLALVVVLVLTAVSWLVEQPPAPVPATAPPDVFSADRAWAHLERIATDEPTPVGSAEGDEVRDHLVAELTRLGLEPQVQRGTGSVTFGSEVNAGRTENVIATIPGTAPTGRLLLAAHYDSTFSGPGASDDKASVAAILEAARALVAGPRPRNDIVLLLTDAEEPGMLGAAAYVDGHPDGRTPGILLNWEGPGNAGSSALFEASPGAAGVVAAFAADAPHRMGSSLLPALVQAMGSHTDLMVLAEAGYEGLTFGFTDGRAYYHSSEDTVANLERGSLQQHGENLLALARAFGERDLPALHSDVDITYFTVAGLVVRYPAAMVLPLALVALAVVVALAVLMRIRGLTTVPRMLAGAATALVALAAAVAAAAGLWEVLGWWQPGYGSVRIDPYRPVPYRWALGALTAAVVLAWCLLLRRRLGVAALVLGGLLWSALLGVVLAVAVPGAAHVGTVPALLVAVAGLVAVGVGERHRGWQLVCWTAGVAPAVVLLLGHGRAVLQFIGIATGGAGAVLFAVAGVLAAPLVAAGLPRRRAALVPLGAIVLAVALAGAGLAGDRWDARHPLPTSLRYVLDADTGEAHWHSTDPVPHDWVRRYTARPATPDPAAALPYLAEAAWTGPAAVAPLPAPELAVLDVAPDRVRVRLRSPRDADVLTLAADRPVEGVAVVIGGTTSQESPEASEPGAAWPFHLQFYDPPAEGIEVELRVADSAGMRLAVGDHTSGFDGLPGYVPRPPELTRSPMHDSDIAVVTRTYRVG